MTIENTPKLSTFRDTSPESMERRQNRVNRILAGVAIVAVLGTGAALYGINKAANYPSTTVSAESIPRTESDPNGAVDNTIDAILAFDGAEAHSDPYFVDQNPGDPKNVIETVHNKDGSYTKVPEHNVLVKSDPANKLKWYGVQKDGKTEWYPSTEAVAIRQEK